LNTLNLLELEIADPSEGACDVLDGEGFLWRFHAPVVQEFSLYAESTHSIIEIFHAAVAESLFAALLTLKSLIRRARQSSGNYENRLRAKGHGAEDASLALLIAGLKGEVDDLGYASYLLELRYERRREGRMALRHWLLRKGFARPLVDAVLAAHCDTVDPLADACALLAKRFKPGDLADSKTGRRAWAFLAGRGYDAETARRALRRFFQGEDILE
jgi:SOS response regulatory protein OraA/RecX